jgi:IclR family acetate operon transcriptional repressor
VGEWRTDISAVASPIFDHEGRAKASLSISAPASRMTAELRPTYGALVTEAAQRVSATLGYRRPLAAEH